MGWKKPKSKSIGRVAAAVHKPAKKIDANRNKAINKTYRTKRAADTKRQTTMNKAGIKTGRLSKLEKGVDKAAAKSGKGLGATAISRAFKGKFGSDKKKPGSVAAAVEPAAAAAPVDPKTGKPHVRDEDSFNPYPFDWAKRAETTNRDGTLKDNFKLDVTKERAESPWLKQQLAKQGMEESAGKDNAAKNAASERANASSGLAATSGASAGSMERMQSASSKDALLAQQNVGQQGQQQRQDMRIGDTERQIGADETNINNNLNQVEQTYGGDKDLWKTKSAAYGGEQMAQSIEDQKPTDSYEQFYNWRDKNKGLGSLGNMNPANAMKNPAGAMQGQNPTNMAGAGKTGLTPSVPAWMKMGG